MEHVRLPLLSMDYLIQRVEGEPLFKANLACKLNLIFLGLLLNSNFLFFCCKGKDLLIEALKFHLVKSEVKVSFDKSPRMRPRQPVGLPKVSIFFNALSLQLCN